MYAKLTSKGQITIPRQVREKLKLEKGSIVSFTIKENRVELIPVEDNIMSLRGSVPVNAPQDFDAIEETVEKEIAKDVAQNA